MTEQYANDNEGRLLVGADEIARFLGISRRRTYALVYSKTIPTFRVGSSVAASRASLDKWIAGQEAA